MGVFIIALTVAQALLALHGHRPAALAWLLGVVVFVAVAAPIADLEKRVEIGFLVGAGASTLAMAISLVRRMHKGVDEGVDSLITQIEHEPLET
jgi:hypothetical protein